MNTALAVVSGVEEYEPGKLIVAYDEVDAGIRNVLEATARNPVNLTAAKGRLLDFMARREILKLRQIENALRVAAHERPLIDLRQWPFTHQIEGIEALIANPYFGLFDEMGAGKTKQTIDAAQFLFHAGLINRVIVIAPAAVRSVWFESKFGELAKHLWLKTPATIIEWHARERRWAVGPKTNPNEQRMEWIITNYDFIRAKSRIKQLKSFVAGQKTLLVLDESAYVKNHKAQQTKSCLELRKDCGRVVLLNGTPIANNPLDMYSQGNLMHPTILSCKTYFECRARYAIVKRIDTGRVQFPKIVGWQNLDDLQRRFAPYVLRRLKKDCLDLPDKLPPVNLIVTLTDATWSIYREMRDELCVWLDRNSVTAAAQAPVKVMRLAQILSGFVGGVEDPGVSDIGEDIPDWIDLLGDGLDVQEAPESEPTIRWIGREKLDLYLDWVLERLGEDDVFKLITWCRFKPELFRLIEAINTDQRYKAWRDSRKLIVAGLHGGQKKREREYAMSLLHPDTSPQSSAVVVLGTKGTGGVGTQMHAAHTVFGISDDFSYYKGKQSDDRVHRPGQTHAVSYFNAIAEGPKGQKTIDHLILKARENRELIATMTAAAWIRELREE